MKKRIGVIIRKDNLSGDINLYSMDTNIKKLKDRCFELNSRPSAVSHMGNHYYYTYIFKWKWIDL